MIPREAGRGCSFKGAGAYYLHDKGTSTSKRVAFTHVENCPTQDAHKALKWMAWTSIHAEDLKRESGAKMTGRRCEKPVFTFSLSWHPEEEPDQQEMIGAGRTALGALGLQDHETVMVSHSDRPHPHLHVIVNLVHPETGRANRASFSKQRLSRWAEEYERDRKVYCRRRTENNAQRSKEDEVHQDLKSVVTNLYQTSDSGEAFRTALAERGLMLVQGEKRIVLLDSTGRAHSLSRKIDGFRAKDIRAKLAGLKLPDLDSVREEIVEREAKKKQGNQRRQEEEARKKQKTKPQANYFDRDQQDREWQESIIDAAIKADEQKAAKKPESPRSAETGPHLLNALQDRHLAERGRHYTESTQARLRLGHKLDKAYGEHERKLRHDIGRLQNLLETSGPVRKVWLRMSGQIPKEPEAELENMRRTLENIEMRKSEVQQGLESEITRRGSALDARHREEQQLLRAAMSWEDPPVTEPHYDMRSEKTDPEEDCGPSFQW